MKYNFLVAATIFSFIPTTMANYIELNENNFILSGEKAEFSTKHGKKCISLNNGEATLNNFKFTNGTIEYDVAFNELRNFVGVNFREQDNNNTENFYLRPHQSGNPDANQYTPVYNGVSAWQLYHHGFSAKVNYHFDKWNRVKIQVQGQRAQFFINDMTQPAFSVDELLGASNTGGISFSSPINDACFTNINVTKSDDDINLPIKKPIKQPSGIIKNWQVSTSFALKDLSTSPQLSKKVTNQLHWENFVVDKYGVLNMAKAQGVTRKKDTALAKATIHAQEKQTKALNLGFSDQAAVYLNGEKIYQGNNMFRSRDYRYLGTIGLFDTIYLPLKPGKNDLVIAVSETFGGWGIKATITEY